MMREQSIDPGPGTKTASRFPSLAPPKGFEQLFQELERIVVSRDVADSKTSDELSNLRMQVDSLKAAAERTDAERRDLERRLEKVVAREALFRRTLEWYAEGPFGRLATDALGQPATDAAARIQAERELFFAPLENSCSLSRSGRAVRIIFEAERSAKRFYDSIAYFLPTTHYFGAPR
ncbi:MAG TPA: hypothetical protein VGF92_11195 [Stellaceae bacterium]|jgi:hypothetical protein